jgi:hypothetical protein
MLVCVLVSSVCAHQLVYECVLLIPSRIFVRTVCEIKFYSCHVTSVTFASNSFVVQQSMPSSSECAEARTE